MLAGIDHCAITNHIRWHSGFLHLPEPFLSLVWHMFRKDVAPTATAFPTLCSFFCASLPKHSGHAAHGCKKKLGTALPPSSPEK